MSLLKVFQDPRAPHRIADKLTIQIHSPLPDQVPIGHHEPNGKEIVDAVVSRAEYLERIQQACAEHGETCEIRFYDHFDTGFDASVLDQLAPVQTLSIDGMFEVRNPEAIAGMPRLKSLNFSPRGKFPPNILSVIDAQRLERLTLGETFSPRADLTPLGSSRSLRTLRLLSQGNNLDAIGHCTSLTELSLQPTERQGLTFINRLQQLQVLKLSVGTIRSIEAIRQLGELRDLSLYWVHTLEELGNLQRFPKLRRIQIELQKRLKRLRVGSENAALEHIEVGGIDEIDGFSELRALKSFRNFDGKFAPDWSELPPTLTHFALVTPNLKKREKHYADVRAHGLDPDQHPEAHFSYK